MKRIVVHLFSALAICLMPAVAALGQGSKTVQGIEVSYGVVPAQIVAKSAEKHDPKMHKEGKLLPTGSHHLVVALTDVHTGQRINDATVIATVSPLGLGSTEKRLDPMLVNDTTTYGGFFDFPPSSAPFRIALKITRPDIPSHNAVAVEFEYRPATSR